MRLPFDVHRFVRALGTCWVRRNETNKRLSFYGNLSRGIGSVITFFFAPERKIKHVSPFGIIKKFIDKKEYRLTKLINYGTVK